MGPRALPMSFVVPFKPDTTSRAKLDYWVSIERSVPGRMHLIPIFGGHDTLVDLRCAVATSAVARLLDESSGEAVGRRLSDLLSTQMGAAHLLQAYLAAAKSGRPACFASDSRSGYRIQHRLGVGPRFVVEVELRDISAVAQARAAFHRLRVDRPAGL
jgi:hypothetical protein